MIPRKAVIKNKKSQTKFAWMMQTCLALIMLSFYFAVKSFFRFRQPSELLLPVFHFSYFFGGRLGRISILLGNARGSIASRSRTVRAMSSG